MSNNPQTSSPSNRHRLEGPKNHYIAYLVSILLTILAFAAVIYTGLDKSFLIFFLVGMALVQAIFQLAIWMHMKERGHVYAMVGIIFGFIVALSGVAAAVFWMWW
ncbi:cytochrome C oxidase subunit IV family protein [Paenibacillus aurantius]|uniref:Cytochrome C oxidase subunit IV family protein n=1 Tax=Paenibacillus aurantius TaxID=2918900 RepID=A0AA96RG16_9BACL|nr:cytochrome C oxidase subunit IV family protein [Paenibacillus aurantius]WJH36512.1 cytochrome C oxidase subunit IV family protein [Paenibacillus sp. CC-CFT747]WNQ11848.1 cytochrome C oxidase subunit IV family protein [Paenibacillus aurantius]